MTSLLLLLAAPLLAQSADLPRLGDVQAVWRAAQESTLELYIPTAFIDNPWRRAAGPAKGPASSIGGYAAGCLRGALALPLSGPGYEVMRPSRRRNYGHPVLIDYLQRLGQAATAAGLDTVLVGDLAQPRGGPTLTGHASHQNGLDVDVWYRMAAQGARLGSAERENWSSPELVVPDFERLSADWDPRVLTLLKVAATGRSVERIFVNPVIKKEACARFAGAAWLSKLRPWWGHDDHFHVRLACPSGDGHCAAQEAPPSGDGCGADLSEWFTAAKKAEARRQRTEAGEPPRMPSLPAACRQVLAE